MSDGVGIDDVMPNDDPIRNLQLVFRRLHDAPAALTAAGVTRQTGLDYLVVLSVLTTLTGAGWAVCRSEHVDAEPEPADADESVKDCLRAYRHEPSPASLQNYLRVRFSIEAPPYPREWYWLTEQGRRMAPMIASGPRRRATLAEIRQESGITRAQVARVRGVHWASIENTERRDPASLHLGTVLRHLGAVGRRVTIVAIVDNEAYILADTDGDLGPDPDGVG